MELLTAARVPKLLRDKLFICTHEKLINKPVLFFFLLSAHSSEKGHVNKQFLPN